MYKESDVIPEFIALIKKRKRGGYMTILNMVGWLLYDNYTGREKEARVFRWKLHKAGFKFYAVRNEKNDAHNIGVLNDIIR